MRKGLIFATQSRAAALSHARRPAWHARAAAPATPCRRPGRRGARHTRGRRPARRPPQTGWFAIPSAPRPHPCAHRASQGSVRTRALDAPAPPHKPISRIAHTHSAVPAHPTSTISLSGRQTARLLPSCTRRAHGSLLRRAPAQALTAQAGARASPAARGHAGRERRLDRLVRRPRVLRACRPAAAGRPVHVAGLAHLRAAPHPARRPLGAGRHAARRQSFVQYAMRAALRSGELPDGRGPACGRCTSTNAACRCMRAPTTPETEDRAPAHSATLGIPG